MELRWVVGALALGKSLRRQGFDLWGSGFTSVRGVGSMDDRLACQVNSMVVSVHSILFPYIVLYMYMDPSL